MAEHGEEDDGKSGNTFNNDGSFMEQFMKMQKEKEATETKPETKNVGVKLPPIKKLAPASLMQKRLKRLAAKKASPNTGTESDERGESESKTEAEPSATPSSTMAGDQPGASSSVATSTAPQESTDKPTATKGRKRKSKWDVGATTGTEESRVVHEAIGSFTAAPTSVHTLMSAGQQQQQQLTTAQLEQLREQIAMQKMVAEIKAATVQPQVATKQNQLEYDSDEDTEGGTWEHKARTKEMRLTELKAKEMTDKGKGKHHIGDFLPPEELEKFIETVKAVKEDRPADFSDYKEHKLTEENIGFKLLQKSGWDEGKGLGAQNQGITAPVNKGPQSFDQSGLGVDKPAEVQKADSEYDLYRKRMMLAYRFRPNPLNNPRRPYY